MRLAVTKLQSTSDWKVSFGVLAIGAGALLLLFLQIIDRLEITDHAGPLAAVIFWTEIAVEMAVLGVIALVGPLIVRELTGRNQMIAEVQSAHGEVETLFEMTEMLQSALGHGDANAVLRSTAEQLLPGFGGALHIFNNSRDRLDLSTAWNWPEDVAPAETIAPDLCWALKRGKPHFNYESGGTLRCEHHRSSTAVLEIPMAARGEVYGLLSIVAPEAEIQSNLSKVNRLTTAIADAMSLTLSNIMLREKLRTQALRDPLTGLYNRRYMEDVLERYGNLAERNGAPLTALMIDLDHFKRLNDEHGHAVGDAVLADTAAAIVGGIRPCDVACRYGGEELVILLPDCSLEDGRVRAENLRKRIEDISERYDARVSASFGASSFPETTGRIVDLIGSADAALYRAKQEGRNRVNCAGIRTGPKAIRTAVA